MKPLIRNQSVRIDNHGGPNNDFSKVHIDKTNYDYNRARCKIYIDSGKIEWTNCPDALKGKIIKEISSSLSNKETLKEFGKGLAKKVYEWREKRVTEDTAIGYAKEIARAFGLKEQITERMTQYVGDALRRMITTHHDGPSKFYVDQGLAGIEVGEFKDKRIYLK